MSKNIYRTLIIWLSVVLGIIFVYPTIGWMSLSEASRQARLEKWQKEDDAAAINRPGDWTKTLNKLRRWAEFDRTQVINLGLDLQGGIHMVIGFDIKDLPEEKLKEYREKRNMSDADIEHEIQKTVLNQVTTRVNDFEAKEPVIQTLGTTQIQIQLPGEKDVQRAKSLITKTAQLNFHIVAGPDQAEPVFKKIRDAFPEEFIKLVHTSAMRNDVLTVPQDNYERVKAILKKAEEAGIIPADKMVAFSQKPKITDTEKDYQLYVLDKKPLASGEGLSSSMAMPDQSNPPYWQILFEFNAASSAAFAEATGQNIGNPMAIVVDGVVLSAPTIRDKISGGRGQISGSFEAEESRDLAIALNSGSMVVPVREEFTRTISASLGLDAVSKGVKSSLFSVLVVAIFMVVYYMGSGIIAVVALVLNSLFLIALMAYFHLTLTLPGIAGLVLTIGMAVDANVLIYERIREEIQLGHTLLSSVENGFKRAATVIIDSNVTTLIAGAVLMQFGTGPIKGFAVTLNIGVVTTMFAALVITPALFEFALRHKLIRRMKMLSVIPQRPHIPFMQWRFQIMSITLSAIAIGLVYFGWRGMDNFGVDFRPGTNVSIYVENTQAVPVDQVRQKLSDANFRGPVVQETQDGTGRNNLFIIRVADTLGTGDAKQASDTQGTMKTVADRIRETLAPLAEGGAVDKVVVENEQTVGPSVGAQLRTDAFWAVMWSIVFILLYLWFRFELRFSIGAVVALGHDLLFTIGLFSIVGGEISMGVIAAILTIIGYSLNDTIIVFDRVREDMQLYRGKGVKFMDILNGAINATLSRTIITSMTVLFVTVILLFFGGESLWDFAFVLTTGVVVGTYSSIFIASPIVFYFEGWRKKRQAKAAEQAALLKGSGGRTKAEPRKGGAVS